MSVYITSVPSVPTPPPPPPQFDVVETQREIDALEAKMDDLAARAEQLVKDGSDNRKAQDAAVKILNNPNSTQAQKDTAILALKALQNKEAQITESMTSIANQYLAASTEWLSLRTASQYFGTGLTFGAPAELPDGRYEYYSPAPIA